MSDSTKQWDPEMRGSLFQEQNTKENAPDMTGTVQISGVELRIAVWPSRKSKTSGKAYRPIKVEYKQGTKFVLAKVCPANIVVTGSTAAADCAGDDAGAEKTVDDMPF